MVAISKENIHSIFYLSYFFINFFFHKTFFQTYYVYIVIINKRVLIGQLVFYIKHHGYSFL